MSEEKPTFKITDRRLFNPDGSPREEIREEPTPPPTPAPEAGSTLADVADALGMVNHPGGGGGVNLQLAKQCIDMLGTLQRKTHGNLSGEESQFLDMILSQLRMQYVSLANAPRPPQGGRGFSGGDITGGR